MGGRAGESGRSGAIGFRDRFAIGGVGVARGAIGEHPVLRVVCPFERARPRDGIEAVTEQARRLGLWFLHQERKNLPVARTCACFPPTIFAKIPCHGHNPVQ